MGGAIPPVVIRIILSCIMFLTTLIREDYLASRVSVSRGWLTYVQATIVQFGETLGHAARIGDLNYRNIVQHLSESAKSRSPRTVNDRRQVLFMLWQLAAERGLCPPPDRKRIRKLPEEIDPPVAWTEIQVSDLFGYCLTLDGLVGEVPAADWWLSLFAAIYWTSCRIGSMLAVTSDCYDGRGLLVRRQKNRRPQWFPFPASCREIIERTRPETRKLIWAHPWHQRTLFAKARRIIEAAGLPAPKTGRQLFHRLRRTSITLCAAVDPVVAQRTAGHADFTITRKHYIDPRIVGERSAADVLPDPLALIHGHRPDPPPLYQSERPRFRIYG
jgi:hypothetical protein